MTFAMNAGCSSTRKIAFAGQSVVHVAHNVFGGKACTNGAVPRNKNTSTPSTPKRITRSRPGASRPCGNVSNRNTTHGKISHVEMRPTVYGALCDDSPSAVSDHTKPIYSVAMPN